MRQTTILRVCSDGNYQFSSTTANDQKKMRDPRTIRRKGQYIDWSQAQSNCARFSKKVRFDQEAFFSGHPSNFQEIDKLYAIKFTRFLREYSEMTDRRPMEFACKDYVLRENLRIILSIYGAQSRRFVIRSQNLGSITIIVLHKYNSFYSFDVSCSSF